MRMRKILAHDNAKESTNQGHFLDFYGVTQTKVQLAPPHGNFINGFSEIVYDSFFKKNAYFERKFIKNLMELA